MAKVIETGLNWELRNGDSCEELPTLAENSVDLSLYSPPFSSLYVYSNSERDIGNCSNQSEFLEHLGFIILELLRVTKPGRLTCCHIAQLTSAKATDGVIGIKDLRGDVISAFKQAGWIHHGEVTVDKDPQAVAIRTHSRSLLFVSLKKDRSVLAPALADFVCIFRKPGDNEVPIVGDDVDPETWIKWAHHVWYDIDATDTLNVREARENDDERHICPLQLGLIERCIRLWSNPGELVLSPFAGIGSEGYEAVRHGRRFWGCELKESYARVAAKNLRQAETMRTQQGLFDEVAVAP